MSLMTSGNIRPRFLLADQGSDLAVLKLDSFDAMPFLTFRNSDTVEVGELVLAIGNPFGVGQTVTSGIVSGLARRAGGWGWSRIFHSNGCPINPGNSGGALMSRGLDRYQYVDFVEIRGI